MGFNGKQQSHSVIGFEFSKDPVNSLRTDVYPCNTVIPEDGNFGDYSNVGNCSCAACDQACPAPPVDAHVGFFDGFDGALVAIVYGALILFSIVFQVIRSKFFKGSDDGHNEEGDDALQVQNDDPMTRRSSNHAQMRKDNKINDSGISSNSNLATSAARLLEGARYSNVYDKDD